MPKALRSRDLIFVGTMLFGLFFGAGNLIFPVFLGQEAGTNFWPALIGFLVSGAGIPLLAVTAIGLTQSDGVFDMVSRINRPLAYLFTICLYLCIGPGFATPRLATISFSVGVSGFVDPAQQSLSLWLYSALFFGVAWFFARKPSKIMTYVGKFLTPAFLGGLSLLLIAVLVRPMGAGQAAHGSYAATPLATGFTAGYATMDALAALAFGLLVVDTLRDLGVTEPGQIAKDVIKAGSLAVALMGLLYGLLALLGRNALGPVARATNGGPILSAVAEHYFGRFGELLLAAIVILACLKTAVGLISAFADAFKEMFPRLPYQGLVAVATLVPFLFANVGLDTILTVSTPVLNFIYPIAIVLVLLCLMTPKIGFRKPLFLFVLALTAIPALGDALNALPASLHQGWVAAVLRAGAILPGFSMGLGWCLPALLAFAIGWFLFPAAKQR